MKKKVFILASSDSKIGSQVDVRLYRSFLTSPLGGGWLEDEIYVFGRNVRRKDVLAELRSAHYWYDYVIFIYSGHGGVLNGCYASNVMCLDNGEEIYEREVLGIADRQLTILDSCRTPIEEEPEQVKAAFAESYLPYLEPHRARRCYEEQIDLSFESQYRIFACSDGECASGSSRSGGLFSRLFIEVAKQLSRNARAYSPISVSDAFFKTQSLFEQKRLGQTPDALFPKTKICLPWALGSHSLY